LNRLLTIFLKYRYLFYVLKKSWYYNYKESSRQLFKDDRLYKNPDLVETDDKISWAVSFWFWKQNVRINKKVRNGQFGASTKQINGGLECNGANTQLAKIRFEKYKLTLKAFNIKEDPIESGCY
jgi:predicted chitinase